MGLQALLSLQAHLITMSSVRRLGAVRRHNLTNLYSKLLLNAQGVVRGKDVHYGDKGDGWCVHPKSGYEDADRDRSITVTFLEPRSWKGVGG
jgi:hypothetical protein